MSTFGGVMDEFPQVRVDYFRPLSGYSPPLGCFLSHVHSDHLVGLENFKSPFIYCSAATKELLLRLERYPHRINFASGVLESKKQHYKHLKTLLKPIPLETPTVIELAPGNEIQVTLFDANHCTGAVMFLFEGNGHAVLYTGDIRSEPWFVNALCRNPILVEYTSGLKTLDCIYLDTSNTAPVDFPTKAEGLRELLHKVSAYPEDTTFHFAAWTFGYEEVWMALSRSLRSPIHVDKYKLRLYQSLRGEQSDKNSTTPPFIAHDGPALAGYICGNRPQSGCLTGDQTVRVHSCEKGLHCAAIDENTVWIRPIIARTEDGSEISEVGIGGGGGDLALRPELMLENAYVMDQILALFTSTDDATLKQVKQLLTIGIKSKGQAVSLDDMGLDREEDELSLADLTKILIERVADRLRPIDVDGTGNGRLTKTPKVITFPYSRHSSYAELCHLVKIFKPKEVYPCTFDEQTWHEGNSMQTLFGAQCSGTKFRHDREMRVVHHIMNEMQHTIQQSEIITHSQSSQILPISSPTRTIILASEAAVLDETDRTNELNIAISNSGRVENLVLGTPPHDNSTVSPGSASQRLRRRAIAEGLNEEPNKRPRLNIDDVMASGAERQGTATVLSQKAEEPKSGNSPTRQCTDETNAESLCGDHALEDSPDMAISEIEEEEAGIVPKSFCESWRCNLCGFELWSESSNFCSFCPTDPSEFPYFETPGPTKGSRHGIAMDEYSEELDNEDDRRVTVGDYMDDHLSAYDSQDSDSELHEEYEGNSFIDENEDICDRNDDVDDDETSSGGEKIDYEELYNQLKAAHDIVLDEYQKMSFEYRDLRHDLEIFSDDEDEDDMGGIDENGMYMVPVAAPDPVISEVILSEQDEESQESATNGRDTEESQQVTSGEEGLALKLTSQSNNHTFAEVEL